MRITIRQLRKIIKEEVRRIVEAPEVDDDSAEYFIEINNITGHAESMGASVEEFVDWLQGVLESFPTPTVVDEGSYSPESDSWIAYGSYEKLKEFADTLDTEMMSGAQAISDEDSFANAIKQN